MVMTKKLENNIKKLFTGGYQIPFITPGLIHILESSVDTNIGTALVFISMAIGLSRLLRKKLLKRATDT